MSEFNFNGPVISSAQGAAFGLAATQNRLRMQEEQQKQQELRTYRLTGQQAGGDAAKHAQLLTEAGYPDLAQKVQAQDAQIQKTQLDTKTTVWDYIAKRAGSVADDLSYQGFRRDMTQGGFMNPQDLPERYDANVANGLQQMALGAKAKAELDMKQKEADRKEKHDASQSRYWDAMAGAANTRANTAATKAEQGRPLPSSAAQKLFENQQNLRKAENALALIQGNEVWDTKGDKNATGWKGYVPDPILQRTDPAGVNTRAAIGDIGSMVIHDRSGAAVTASEYPRLRPFIPLVTDDPETVKKKLSRFVQEYRNIVQETSDFHRESGYNVPTGTFINPARDAAAPAGAQNGGGPKAVADYFKR